MVGKNYNYKYIHAENQKGCGRIAFYFDSLPEHNATIPAQTAILSNGVKPKIGDDFKCGACGQTFKHIIIENALINK